MGPYYSQFGPAHGLVMYRDVGGSIDVFEEPDDSRPIGTARCIGWDAAGSAVWRLTVHDEELDDPWVIVDREFLSTRPNWHDLYRSDIDSAGTRRRGPSSPNRGRRAEPHPATLTGTSPGTPPAIP